MCDHSHFIKKKNWFFVQNLSYLISVYLWYKRCASFKCDTRYHKLSRYHMVCTWSLVNYLSFNVSLQVDVTGGYPTFNKRRFAQQFAREVANVRVHGHDEQNLIDFKDKDEKSRLSMWENNFMLLKRVWITFGGENKQGYSCSCFTNKTCQSLEVLSKLEATFSQLWPCGR